MRNGAIRVPSLVAIAIWLGAIAPALAAPELASDPSSLSAADGIFDALQRDMLMMKDRLGVVLSAVPQLPEIGPFLLRRLTKQYEPNFIWILGLELGVIFAGAVVGEAIARRMFRPLHRFLPALDVRTEFGQLGALLGNALSDFSSSLHSFWSLSHCSLRSTTGIWRPAMHSGASFRLLYWCG